MKLTLREANRVENAKHVSQLSFAQIAADPAFPDLLQLLTSLGLLAGKWTAEDVLTALDRLQSKIEVVTLNETAPKDTYEELLYRRALRRDVHASSPEIRRYKREFQQALRADETYREAERTRERSLRQKRRKEQRLLYLKNERAQRKAALKARLQEAWEAA